ncbi:GNAT family N-acetyltransferase [Alkalimonas amylolytica]|uniref:Acetyltransferase (GNAT) family protein n=1 Tax=Alkalimonas amylolytica TaxID=152573 RepID=A0A1H4FQ54_ALKAM|nr:GNAT family N-acetyltransferase [Alkalimonas amylolytica]SEA99415.1 Acetyltransferase (GNAT) family protein [Alkalimonas amylolytica]
MLIRPYRASDEKALLTLANQVHGAGYLDKSKLEDYLQRGLAAGLNASFVAYLEGKLVGYRLSFSAEQWHADEWCNPQLWPVAASKMAYFKSVAVDPGVQGQGIGSQLLQASIEVLQQQGAEAGLAHLWMQSPGNSAVRYFTKAGGRLLAVHQDKWLALSLQSSGYDCPVCGKECHCTAAEMVLEFP